MKVEYYDIYLKRLNRFGRTFQERLQNQRQREFENYMLRSVYRVDFEFEDEMIPGTFEPYKQDNTQTLHYLLTRLDVNIPTGTVLMIPDKDLELKPWMVFYPDIRKASGYNRYIMLRMTDYVTWTARDGSQQASWVYLYGQENNMLKDEIRSRSRMDVVYTENLKLNFFIMPKNPYIKKEIYIEMGEGAFKEGYRVTGYDLHSTPGVEFVSIDPTYLYDQTPPPIKDGDDKEEEFYWLEGGTN